MKTRANLCHHRNTTSTFFSSEEEKEDDEQQIRAGLCQSVPVLETEKAMAFRVLTLALVSR